MALTITPGYDFATNEVPTNLLLRRQASDLRLLGIPASQLDSDIVAIVFGNTSGASGGTPPNTGWIWVDPAGNRVIQTTDDDAASPRIDARLWSAHGGWETGRFTISPNSVGGNLPNGIHLWADSTNFQVEDDRLDMDGTFVPLAVSKDGAASPATNARVCGRGLTTILVGAQVTEINLRTKRPGFHTDAVGQGSFVSEDQFHDVKPFYCGTVMGRSEGTTGDSLAGQEAAGWFVCLNAGGTPP